MTNENGFESIPDPAAEADQIQEIANLTVELLDMRYAGGRILRGVHPKSHGCVNAMFVIREDVPVELRVGMFSRLGASYEAKVRFSNASVRVAHDLEDGKHGSRGMAIKVLDVDGEVLMTDGDRACQDFLMINQPSFAFANVEDYLRLTRTIRANNDDPKGFFAPLQAPPGEFPADVVARTMATFQAVQKLQSIPVANPLSVSYFGAAPFLFGSDRAMHISAAPVGGDQPQLMPESPGENYLGEALRETMAPDKHVYYDIRVQVRGLGEEGLGIENAQTVWDEAATPWINVARLTIPAPQLDLDSPERREECERLIFTPWHCLSEHQPIGGINRLRKAVYLASANHRSGG